MKSDAQNVSLYEILYRNGFICIYLTMILLSIQLINFNTIDSFKENGNGMHTKLLQCDQKLMQNNSFIIIIVDYGRC